MSKIDFIFLYNLFNLCSVVINKLNTLTVDFRAFCVHVVVLGIFDLIIKIDRCSMSLSTM